MINLFKYYCQQNICLWINFEELYNECCDKLFELFLDKKNNKFGKWILFLQTVYGTQIQNLYLFEWIPSKFKINNLFEKRNKLCQITGLPLTCECISKDNIYDITFRPYLLSSNKGKNNINTRFGLRLASMSAPIRNVKISYNISIDCLSYYNHFAPVFMSMNRDLDGGLKEYGQKNFNYDKRKQIKNNKLTTNIRLAIMISEIQNDIKETLVKILNNLPYNYNEYIYNIKIETSINNNWILPISYM
eukprot:544944_1